MNWYKDAQLDSSEYSNIIVTKQTKERGRRTYRLTKGTFGKQNWNGKNATVPKWVPEDQLERYIRMEEEAGAEIIYE